MYNNKIMFIYIMKLEGARTLKRLFLLLIIFGVLIGCSSSFKDNVAEAESALESGSFEVALYFYNLAFEEKADSVEVKAMIALLTDYDTLQEKMTNFEWKEAFDLANEILKRDEIVPSLQKEVKELLTTIEEEKEREEQIAIELKKVEKLIANDEVEEASALLSELEGRIQSTALNSEIESIQKQLGTAEVRVTEKELKELEAKKKRLEEEANQKDAADNLQAKYLQKANTLEKKIRRELREAYPNAQDMQPGFYSQYYTDWDHLLNEVWGVLKDTMPKNEFEKLKSNQNEWINMKEQNFAEMPDETASTRTAGMDYLAFETANRTNYLIENYMN